MVLQKQKERKEKLTNKITSKVGLYITWSSAIIFILVLAVNLSTESHEESHVQICEKFGGVITTTHIDIFSKSYVVCEGYTTSDAYKISQSQVDSFGYQLITFEMIFVLGIHVLGLLIITMNPSP